ncbi:DNA cytosine methyltransferase [Methanolobus bombayensis]|uniref:DNA cytosine methyltransferase n=1 Tax=Methanolobus bombayensis TaxID=38023 RepID=UPI001AEA62CE|nr:DNA (cytosine-5-)-methyltransferase [Methanolobus bombayensis]MBP1910328.1 DNA (cytosine-5)-methyltransferase 1 [Methanolobus bombayensis]
MEKKYRFLDLFAGAGGLSEGFIKSGFVPVAHVEVDTAACYSLKTRMAYHWLNNNGKMDVYYDYLKGNISRSELYALVPESLLDSVINEEISDDTLPSIFDQVDSILDGEPLDLIVGGPPCQAYSIVGRSRAENKMQGDSRNYLYEYYAKFLEKYSPKYFVFENVQGLLSAKSVEGDSYFEKMKQLFREKGYTVEWDVLNANDYGVLQRRKRIILVGKKGDESGFYPYPEKWTPDVKVNAVFNDLPALKAGEGTLTPCKIKDHNSNYLYEAGIRRDGVPVTLHQSRTNKDRDLEIYRIAVQKWNDNKRLNYNDLPAHLKTHRNRSSFLDRFKVVAGKESSSHTVVAHIAKDGHYYIHPDIKQNRSLTPREAARLQTFPDDYFFEGISEKPSRTAAYRQIGNAVPVLLAQKIAEKLKENY